MTTRVQAYVQGPNGTPVPYPSAIVVDDTQTADQILGGLKAQGIDAVTLRKLGSTSTTTAVTSTDQATARANRAAGIGGAIGQIGIPLAASALAPEIGPLALGIGGLLGGLGGAAVGRGIATGRPTVTEPDVTATALSEAATPIARQGVRLLRTLPGAARVGEALTGPIKAIGRGTSRLAGRLHIPLAAGERFEGGLMRQRIPATAELGAAQARGVTQAALRRAEAAGVPAGAGAMKLRHDFLVLWDQKIGALAPDRVGPVLADVTKWVGTSNLKSADTVRRILTQTTDTGQLRYGPLALVKAMEAVGIPRAHEEMAKLWWSEVLQQAAREGKPGSRLFPELWAGKGGTFYLDGDHILQQFRKLSPQQLEAFGPLRRGLSELSSVLDHARSAPQALPRLAALPAKAKPGAVTVNSILSAFWKATNDHPWTAGLIGLSTVGALESPGSTAQRGERVGGALAAIVGGKYLGTQILSKLLSTPTGLRWVAAGIDMQNRGLPVNQTIDALARLLPRMLLQAHQGQQQPVGVQP